MSNTGWNLRELREHYRVFVLGASDNQDEFEQAKVVSEANVIGCMYAARSMVEIFAQLVNELALTQRLAAEKCSLYRVRDALPASRLRTELDALTTSDAFEYVSGFTKPAGQRQLRGWRLRRLREPNHVADGCSTVITGWTVVTDTTG